jgi:hypothetical protein
VAIGLALSLAWRYPSPAEAQAVSGQSFQVMVDSSRPVTVGDTVTLRFRVRLDERDLLFDTVPQPLGALPPGARILSVDKLTRTPDRIFHGSARLAFYRPGRQPVPTFMLPFMRAVKGVQRATLASDSAWVQIRALLPAGSPPLKDIRELRLKRGVPGVWPLIALAGFALLIVGVVLARKPSRRQIAAEQEPAPRETRPPPAYDQALARLNHIENERWPEQNQMARHYEEIVDTLRDYLEAAAGVPARESTSAELLWSLPPQWSAEGLRESLDALLEQADLVKFAKLIPDRSSAAVFLADARSLLGYWHSRASENEVADALR